MTYKQITKIACLLAFILGISLPGCEVPDEYGAYKIIIQKRSGRTESLAVSPNGQRIMAGCSAIGRPTIEVWDTTTGERQLAIEHPETVNSVAFSPDGKFIASGVSNYDANYAVKIWDATTGKQIISLEGHDKAVMSVAFSPDSKSLVSGCVGGKTKIWDLKTGKERLSLE